MSDLLEMVGAVVVVVALLMVSPWLLAACGGVLLIGVGYNLGRGGDE